MDPLEGIEGELETAMGSGDASKETKHDAPAPEVNPPADVKGASADAAKENEVPGKVDDPEFEIDKDLKLTRSQIKQLKENGLLKEDYSKKIGELSEKEKQFAPMVQFIQQLKQYPEKAKQFLSFVNELTAPAKTLEAASEKVEDLKQMMAGMDPNHPATKILQKVLERTEKLEQQLQGTQETVFQKDYQEAVKTASNVLTKTMDEVTKSKDWKLSDPLEQKMWKHQVLSFLKDNPREYKDEAEFVSTIGDVGKKVHDAIVQIGELRLKEHLKKKSAPAPLGPGGSSASEKDKELSFNDLQGGLEKILAAELEK